MMIRQCAWCREVLDSPVVTTDTVVVTHGICAACEHRFAGAPALHSLDNSPVLSSVLLG